MTDAPTNADLLAAAGRTLYGPEWKRALARLLNVAERRMHYYAANERQPPASLLNELAGHLQNRATECHDLALTLATRAQDS